MRQKGLTPAVLDSRDHYIDTSLDTCLVRWEGTSYFVPVLKSLPELWKLFHLNCCLTVAAFQSPATYVGMIHCGDHCWEVVNIGSAHLGS